MTPPPPPPPPKEEETAATLKALLRAKALFQLRSIAEHMGIPKPQGLTVYREDQQ